MSRLVGRLKFRHAVLPCVVLAWSLVSGCSGSDASGDSGSDPTVAATAVAPTTTTAVPAITEPEVQIEPASVRIDVSARGTSAELTGTLADSDDPFGNFVSCSGLRSTYGTYSVLASAESGAVRSISVVSADLVPEPGVHESSVRVEFSGAPAVDAVGTITVGDDRRSGSFLAFDADGATVDGTFDCSGGDTEPQPLVVGSDNGVLEAVEVFALLRSGDQERILGLATPADGAALVECAGAEGEPDGSVPGVHIEGDESIGAISVFELSDGTEPTMRLGAGSLTYTSGLVMRGGADPGAGSFSAEANGVAIDGAFRCS